jgi:hypothetical protein
MYESLICNLLLHLYTFICGIWLVQWFPTCGTRTPGGYAADRLGVRENNIGNGGNPPTPKGVKLKTQKRSYEVLVHKERLM